MIRKISKLLDQRFILLLVFMLIASPLLGGRNTYTICLIYSHYLCVYMNNVFLLMNYQFAARLNTLLMPMMTRIGEKVFYINSYIVFMMTGLVYTLIIYISYAFFFGAIDKESLSFTILFMILNILITLMENTIIYWQVGQKKNFLYLALPIFINFAFHIFITTFF